MARACRMWVPPETVDPVLAARADAQGRRLLRRGPLARRSAARRAGTRPVQRGDVPSVSANPVARRGTEPSPRRRDCRQCVVPSRPAARHVVCGPGATILPRLPAALQSGAESDRAGVETDAPTGLSQSVLPDARRARHRASSTSLPRGVTAARPCGDLCAIT